MAAAITADEMQIMPRQDMLPGRAKGYRVETSDNGETFSQVAAGEFDSTPEMKSVTFPEVTARFFRVVHLSSYNEGTIGSTDAEIYLLNDGVSAARSGWRIKANSECPVAGVNYGPATYAIDGNASTYWHTSWPDNQPQFPNTITIDTAFVGIPIKPEGVTVVWDSEPAATMYELVYTNLASDGQKSVTVEVPSAVLTDITPGDWAFKVRAFNPLGTSEFCEPITEGFSMPVDVPPPVPVPPAPKGLRILRIETSSNAIDWDTDGVYVVRPDPAGGYPAKQFFRMVATVEP